MNTNNFQVVITNQLGENQDKNLVTKKLAALFKTDEAKAAQLLIRPRTVIKDKLDKAAAHKYLIAIQQTGAHCEIIDTTLATDLPQIVEPPKSDPAKPSPRTSSDPRSHLTGDAPLSLVAREEKIEQETREKLTTLKNASEATLCPECGTIRGAVDALCLHCGYSPSGVEPLGESSSKKKIIAIAAGITAIVIIALAISLPYYQKMLARKKMDQDFKLAFDVRNQVSSFIDQTGFLPNQNMDANLPDQISNDAIESIIIGDNAVITVTMQPAAANNTPNQTIIFTSKIAHGKIVWNCMQGTLANEYRPEICRN